MKSRLTPVALNDIERAADWYERKRVGLGLEFSERVLESIEKIELNPFGYEKVFGKSRRAELVQFPYNLWFEIHDEAVVIACLHGAARPCASQRTRRWRD